MVNVLLTCIGRHKFPSEIDLLPKISRGKAEIRKRNTCEVLEIHPGVIIRKPVPERPFNKNVQSVAINYIVDFSYRQNNKKSQNFDTQEKACNSVFESAVMISLIDMFKSIYFFIDLLSVTLERKEIGELK